MPEPTQTHESEQNSVQKFLSEATALSKEYAKGVITKEDPRFLSVVDSLGNVGAEISVGMLDMEELVKGHYPTDRNTKAVLRSAHEVVEARAADTEYEDPEMANLIASGTRRVIPLFGVPLPRQGYERKDTTPEEYFPTVGEEALATLTPLEALVDKDKSPTPAVVKGLASAYLSIYYPAKVALERASGQKKADLIAESHAYAHTFGKLLSLTTKSLRNSAWNGVKDEIIKQTALETGVVYSDDDRNEQPEVSTYQMMLKGVRLELATYEELEKLNGKQINGLRYADMDEDIKEQFDIAFRDGKGNEFYLDTKSGKPFEDMVNKNLARQVEDGVALKRSRGSDKDIIVINIDKRGYGGRDTRQFELSDPVSFQNALVAGIKAIRALR